jgi:hypothetical protein
MDAFQVINLAENGSYRANLLYLFIGVNTLLSWTSSLSWLGFIFSFLYYTILEVIVIGLLILIFTSVMFFFSLDSSNPSDNFLDYFSFKDADFERVWSGKKFPWRHLSKHFLMKKLI